MDGPQQPPVAAADGAQQDFDAGAEDGAASTAAGTMVDAKDGDCLVADQEPALAIAAYPSRTMEWMVSIVFFGAIAGVRAGVGAGVGAGIVGLVADCCVPPQQDGPQHGVAEVRAEEVELEGESVEEAFMGEPLVECVWCRGRKC